MNCYWIKNTEYELQALRQATDSVAMIPLASIESHGPHLPIGSDSICADHVVRMIVEQEPVAVLPTLHYSYVADARMRPGAIHIPSHILMDMMESVCDEVYRNGFDKVVLLHCHGGNVALHWMFCRRCLEREKPYAVYTVPVFGNKGQQIIEMCSTEPTGHACEMETSLNMAAYPEGVKLQALGDKTFPPQPAPQVDSANTAVDWTAKYPEMAVGYPQKASVELGQRVYKIWRDEIVETLRKIKADRVTLEGIQSYIKQAHSIRQQ